MYLKRGLGEGGLHFCNLKSICLKHLVYGVDHSMKLCKGWQLQVNIIEIYIKLQKHGPRVKDRMARSGVYK